MRICVVGTRGFPDVQGGVETHCEHLYPILAGMGCEVTVFTRAPYTHKSGTETYRGVRLVHLECTRNKFLEAIHHTAKALWAARRLKPDVVHIHAIGPSLMVPLAKLLGLRVVMTHHGPDYERKKWGALAKAVLKTSEWVGARTTDRLVCISRPIADAVRAKTGRSATIIPNGVVLPTPLATDADPLLGRLGLSRGKYFLTVTRFVPEKGLHDLLEAYEQARQGGGLPPDWRLVLVGRADHADAYSRRIEERAKACEGVVLAGFQSGEALKELYARAGVFVLPSYYEGLPIVLLEAMSYGLSCLVSDIAANREVSLEEARHFKPGDTGTLAAKMSEYSRKPLSEMERQSLIDRVRERYDWSRIAEAVLRVYQESAPAARAAGSPKR